MHRALVAVLATVVGAVTLASGGGAAPKLDYASVALNVLPPGQSGSLNFPKTATDQLRLYDGLTPLFDRVTDRDLRRLYKSARFGADGRTTRLERPRAGVRIVRDRWEVPHVYGTTRTGMAFGAGWATAEDRGLLMNLLRGPGRIAALDVPGINAFALAASGRQFVPSARTEAFLGSQAALLRAQGRDGRLVLADIDAYVAGINAYNRKARIPITPWTRNDVIAVAALIGAVFGRGGGDEVRASMLLDALQTRLGADRGRQAWNDLRALDDPESPVAVEPRRFPYGTAASSERGNAVVADGTFEPWRFGALPLAAVETPHMSNALLIGRRRSATGHPLFVAGPQTGHSYPQILMELDLHGGGIDARGAAFPGISFAVLVGRGKDFAWSATSANGDIVDEVVETLCGGDTRYIHRGECRDMDVFDAGVLRGATGQPDERIVFRQTVHGPVTGYAVVGGARVAIAEQRSTRGREVLSALFFADLNANRVDSAPAFIRAASRMELTFNWLYADDRDIAQFTSGRLPVRPADTALGLPRRGSGEFEWNGFVAASGHPQVINPPGGAILNWNNRPARGFAAADDEWSWGSVQRVQLLDRRISARGRHTLTSVVAAMNAAATTDIRAAIVFPLIRDVLRSGPGGSARSQRMVELLEAWRVSGSSRLDRDLDGRIDDPGAAIMDAAWPLLADAALSPVLGPLVDRLAALETRDDAASPDGSSYGVGWYGYLEKDLRQLLGRTVRGAYGTRFCGNGALAACRDSLWAALEAAGATLVAVQGPDPVAWRADATRERIQFGFLPDTARFTNRPTFQQVMTFGGHRPR